jgi:hypothetical protein
VRQFGSVFEYDASGIKTTTPNAQTSARLSAACPLACSGAMYAAVPRITPTPVICAGLVIVGDCVWRSSPARPGPAPSVSFARPKSSTFTLPSGVILMFAGFKSRWMMP